MNIDKHRVVLNVTHHMNPRFTTFVVLSNGKEQVAKLEEEFFVAVAQALAKTVHE